MSLDQIRREVSRFARNSRDWRQLIEMCRVVDTVLIDQETVYAPRQGNDRLLLGLKAALTSMNSTPFASAPCRLATRKRDGANSSSPRRSAS
jgi:hypothetical protein